MWGLGAGGPCLCAVVAGVACSPPSLAAVGACPLLAAAGLAGSRVENLRTSVGFNERLSACLLVVVLSFE